MPNNVKSSRKYILTEERNVITKVGEEGCLGKICENILDKKGEYIWKIKILKTQANDIFIGIAQDFDNKNGRYYHCNSYLFSGRPHNYNFKSTTINNVEKEILVKMNMNNGTLSFIIDNKYEIEEYKNIPLDKPITPSILLFTPNDSVEITEYLIMLLYNN